MLRRGLIIVLATLAVFPAPAAEAEIEPVFREAARLYGRNEMKQAATFLVSALDRFPDSGRLHYLLGLVYWDSLPTRRQEAVAELAMALRLDADLPDVASTVADFLIRAGKGDEARLLLHDRIASHPEDADALRTLGELLFNDGDRNAGTALLLRAVRAAPQGFRGWLALGRAYARAGEMERAVEPLERARDLAPDSGAVRYNLGQAYRSVGRIEEARVELERYQQAEARLVVQRRDESLKRAVGLQEERLREGPDAPASTYADLVALYQEAGSAESGRRFLAAVAAGAPDLAAPRTGQAILEHALGLDDQALLFLSEALRLDPVHVAALELLLEIDPAGERGARAAALLDAAAKHPQAPVQLHAWRGVLDLRRGRLEEAGPHLLEALRVTPDDPNVMLNLGTLYGSTGKLDEARTILQKLVAQNPADGQAWFNLALTETRMGLQEQAEQHLHKALGAGLLRPVVFNLLAELLHRRGETEAARELLRRSLEVAEDQPAVRKRLRKLDSEVSP